MLHSRFVVTLQPQFTVSVGDQLEAQGHIPPPPCVADPGGIKGVMITSSVANQVGEHLQGNVAPHVGVRNVKISFFADIILTGVSLEFWGLDPIYPVPAPFPKSWIRLCDRPYHIFVLN